MNMRIGELAATSGERVKTLRYWDDLGLLPSRRDGNGYRRFDPGAPERVALIRSAQALGFTLRDVRGILELRREGVRPCRHVREHLRDHLAQVRRRLAELRALEGELDGRLEWAERHPEPPCDEGCVYLMAREG